MSDQEKDTRQAPASPFRQMVTEELVKRLEAGTAPWQHYVKPGVLKDIPYNPVSGTRYQGGNHLWLEMQARPDPRWMTYRQAESIGAQIRKGEKGTKVEFWKFNDERPALDDAGKPVLDQDGKPKKEIIPLNRPLSRQFTIFNAAQMDGLEPYKAPELTFNPIERAEAILAGTGLTIHHDTRAKAYYQGGKADQIHLPLREHFKDASAYYATALHEVGHATGHESRLNRDLSGPFGSEKYAREELRAEISSLMVAQKLGIGHDPGNHAAYVKSWIKSLKENPNEIFAAARDAEVIHTWVTQPEMRQELHQRYATSKALKANEAKTMSSPNPSESQEKANQSRTYLNVPIKEKDDAKALGAKWDRVEKSWYAPPGANLDVFAKWQKQPETTETKIDPQKEQGQLASERVNLAVPYRERAAAKEGGALWDALAKTWFAPKGADLATLTPWLPDNRQAPTPTVQRSPVDAFSDAVRDHGLLLSGEAIMDGKWHRLPTIEGKKGEQAGSYRGFADGIPNGQITNFRRGTVQWTLSSEKISPEQREELAAITAANAATRKAELEKGQETASRTAYGIWKNAPAWGRPETSVYLREKAVPGYGVKVNKDGHLLVPLRDTQGHLHNLQTIGQRSEDGPGKTFLKGGQKTGLFHLIDPKKEFGKTPVIIAEGYATAAEIHQATGLPVVVAFDSGNLQPVAQAIRKAQPETALLIAGDNDHHLENKPGGNVGMIKATETALTVNAQTALPTFTAAQKAKGLTDWNDLAKDQGKAAVKTALAPAVAALMKQHQAVQHKTAEQLQAQAKPALAVAPKGLGFGMGLG